MPWTCPKCGKEFQNTNQWHSCTVKPVEAHFEHRPPALRAAYDKLVAETRKIGPFKINSVKTAILLKTKTSFLGVAVRKNHLRIEFMLERKVDEFPVVKHFQLSKNRTVHYVDIDNPEDVDAVLLEWIREAYGILK